MIREIFDWLYLGIQMVFGVIALVFGCVFLSIFYLAIFAIPIGVVGVAVYLLVSFIAVLF